MLPDRRPDIARAAAPADADAADARLIARVAAGELPAFDAVYRAWRPRLLRFLGHMTRRTAVVDEALNDTLFVVWRKAGDFDGRSKVSTWIFGIAYRRLLKSLARFDEPQPDAPAGAEAADEAAAGPEAQRSRSELHAALLRALAALSAEQRAVVCLTHLHGMGYREIAAICNCPVDTVKTRMFHARRRLRTLLPGSREDWL